MEAKIDFSYLESVASVSHETAIELIDYFLIENNQWLLDLKNSAKNFKSGELQASLHKLKGAIRVMGLSFLEKFVIDWENELKQNKFDHIPDKLNQIEAYFVIAVEALKQKRKDLMK